MKKKGSKNICYDKDILTGGIDALFHRPKTRARGLMKEHNIAKTWIWSNPLDARDMKSDRQKGYRKEMTGRRRQTLKRLAKNKVNEALQEEQL